MKFSSQAIVTLALGSASAVRAAVFQNAVKFATQLADASLQPDNGKYKFQNVGTGQFMAFDNSGGTPNIVLKDDGSLITLKHFGNDAYALGLGPDTDPARYCLSSQWSAEDGFNIADTAYLCCANDQDTCDNGGNQGPLRLAKQSHFLVPSDSDAIAATSKAVQGLQKRVAVLIKRFYSLNKQRRASKSTAVQSKFQAGDVVHIIAVDHKDDMAQRAVTGSVITTAGEYKSLALTVVDADDDKQKWRLTSGSD